MIQSKMEIVIRGPWKCWEKYCDQPKTAKTGVLCNKHRKVALAESKVSGQPDA